MKITVAT